MRLGTTALAVLMMVVAGGVIFYLFQRQLSSATFAFGSHPEVLAELEASMEDQKRLSELDPDRQASYRSRFDELATTTRRLQVLEHSRDDLVRRYEIILLGLFVTTVVAVTGVYAWRQGRHQPRLRRLQEALTGLAEGRTDIDVGDRGNDTIGRIAAMVERTSRGMARDRQRLAALRNLSSWQEAARRHAHEIRTPLTGAKLELDRVQDLVRTVEPVRRGEILEATDSVHQEIERLADFTRQFHTFARLPRPQLEVQDLGRLVGEFATTYEAAWQNLRLEPEPASETVVSVDRDLIRQVLVNLCDNSSQALEARSGVVIFSISTTAAEVLLEVADDGPGVAEEIRARLFEPYVTTRRIGEGVGIGLAISKKILLDHGGDLELVESSSGGAVFGLSLPLSESGFANP